MIGFIQNICNYNNNRNLTKYCCNFNDPVLIALGILVIIIVSHHKNNYHHNKSLNGDQENYILHIISKDWAKFFVQSLPIYYEDNILLFIYNNHSNRLLNYIDHFFLVSFYIFPVPKSSKRFHFV